MSPVWCSPVPPPCPCGLPVGLKCPPALLPSPELQSPFSWTWKPCVVLGGRPATCALTITLLPCCSNTTWPDVLLPFVGCSTATARAPSIPTGPPLPTFIDSICPQPASAMAPAAATHHLPFILRLRCCCPAVVP